MITFRVAFCHEGMFWNAYLAQPDTMKDAVLIGSIVMRAVAINPECRAAFVSAMRGVMETASADLGVPIDGWNDPVSCPEHEKASRA